MVSWSRLTSKATNGKFPRSSNFHLRWTAIDWQETGLGWRYHLGLVLNLGNLDPFHWCWKSEVWVSLLKCKNIWQISVNIHEYDHYIIYHHSYHHMLYFYMYSVHLILENQNKDENIQSSTVYIDLQTSGGTQITCTHTGAKVDPLCPQSIASLSYPCNL